MAAAGACAQSGLPTLSAGSAPPETASTDTPSAIEAAVFVSGTPTEAYATVAHGILTCWFGGDGPLRPTHVFHADAKPPAQGGSAEITIYERDPAQRDQRGPRAFHVSFEAAAQGVRVGTSTLKMPPPLADAMVRDVEAWVKGGTGCQVRVVNPPPPAPQPPPPPARSRTRKT